jgi:hypothetical protein
MYANCMTMPQYPPPFMWPGGPYSQPQRNPVEEITNWIKGLEDMKKHFKEEKKDDKKEKKSPAPSVIGTALLMLLLSPITGPMMFYFFQLSLGIIHK